MSSQTPRPSAESRDIERLKQFVDAIRPRDGARDAEANLRAEIAALRADSAVQQQFCTNVRDVLARLRLVHVLVQSGILADTGIVTGARALLGHMLIPRVAPEDDLRTVMTQVFCEHDDWQWVNAIPSECWIELFDIIIEEHDAIGLPHDDVAAAIRALAQHIGATGIDEEVNAKLTHVEDYDSPFLDLSVVSHQFLEDHRHGPGTEDTFRAVVHTSNACRELVLHLRENKHIYGTSIRLTGVTRRLLQQLDRFDLLLHLVRPSDSGDFARSVAPLFKDLVEAEQTSGSLRRHIGQNLDLWAYQITEHTAKKGAKYVGRSAREYWTYLLAAMGGGALVAMFAVFKLFLSKLDLPLAIQALIYGVNYSICFTLIYVTGAILATKQPAITASTIARCIDESTTEDDALHRVAHTIMLVWRSQFISFVGNIICAFPIAIVIAYGLKHMLAIETADTAKSQALLAANHPWESGALFYAGIAGVLLFTAGIVQGAVDNRIIYTELHERLSHHRGLAFLGRWRQGVVDFVIKHASGITGNVVLGFMLGSAGTIGIIFGLPLDIRHIAFSSSHVGVATLDAPQLVDITVLYTVMIGIIGIGFVNFAVSFGLTLVVTFKSRHISFGQSGALLLLLATRFFRAPLHWFLPLGPYDYENKQPAPPDEPR